MLKNVKVILVFLLVIVGLGVYLASTSKSIYFSGARDLLVRAMVVGTILGGIRAVKKTKPKIVAGEVTRHDAGSFLSHWGTATGIFLLIASGIMIGFFPSADTALTEKLFAVNLHFVGLVITLFCGLFWAVDFILSRNYSDLVPNIKDIIYGTLGKYLLRREWHYEGRYLSSQKAAFLAFAVIGSVILITGTVKVAAYIWPITTDIHTVATFIHDVFSIFFILLLIMHVAIVIALRHWLALKSWVTGKMPIEYVKAEYPIWYDELKKESRDDSSKY